MGTKEKKELLLIMVSCLCLSGAGCQGTQDESLELTSSYPTARAQSSPLPAPLVSIPLSIEAATTTVNIGSTLTLTGAGGLAPYSFSILQGGGTLSSTSGPTVTFSSPHQTSTTIVEVVDSVSQRASIAIQVLVGSAVTPNDELFQSLTGMIDIRAPEAWALQTDCRKIVVGVLDSGIDYTHPDLAENIVSGETRGWNFVDNTNDATDDHFHGTHVSGVIGGIGNNNNGVTGICWKASILPIKVMDQDGSGRDSDIIAGINYGLSMGVKVFNMSIGGPENDPLMKSAIEKAGEQGALIVAAAGNDGADNDSSPDYPASYNLRNIISVASVDRSNDQLAGFSNYGSHTVHIAAPGVRIFSTTPTRKTAPMRDERVKASYAHLTGTSMAAPYVTGVAALLWSFEPSLTVAEVKSRILDRSDIIPGLQGKVMAGRRLNVFKTLYGP